MNESSDHRASHDGIRGRLASLYDVFVDWPGRLSREMPGLTRLLRAAGVRRVLDAGCGTGRHVKALREAGFDAFGADVSEDMLEQAGQLLGGRAGLAAWRLGEEPGEALREAGPFDAVICLGNVWPALQSDREVAGAMSAMHGLLRPGGVLIVGLKAVEIRRAVGGPYMPLLKREHEGRALFFVRFVDFDVPEGPGGEMLCDFHMVVVGGDGAEAGASQSCELHECRRVRSWSASALGESFSKAGFVQVNVSGSIGDPGIEVRSEDVFVHARRAL